MRILITTQPGYGHLHPLVPLARAARSAGHEVLVATSASMCPVVESVHLPCAPAGLDWLLTRERDAFPEMAHLPFGDEHFRMQLARVFRDVTARRMVPDLLDLCRSWQPDVIVRDDQEHGALIVAELLDIPHAVAGVLWLYPPDLQSLVSDSLEMLLADHGLTGIPAIGRAYRYLTLASMPPDWIGPGEYVPPTTHLLRPEAFANENESEEESSSFCGTWPEHPLVHASLGTIVARHTGLNEVLLMAFRDLPVNLVLSVGPDQDPAAFGPQPANIQIIDNIPPGIGRRCDAAIVHAGYGSAMGAIVHGKPMVLLPVAADQPRNARRCVDLGLGIALFEGQWEPQRIRDAVMTVLGDPGYRARSAKVQSSLATLPGAEHGVTLLEQLSASRQPLPGNRSSIVPPP
jgi:UDP:flavonoid glycosyltransferase YjiC (YdhE family)